MSPPREIDLLIVGGGVAAARCARTLRRRGFDGSILVVGDEPLAPYNRPPLSKELLLHDEPLPDDLLLAEPVGWYARRRVELQTDVSVRSLDLGQRLAVLSDGTVIHHGRCLIATGAAPRRLAIPGGERALLLRTAADSRRLRAAMDASPGAPVVVVGGGFIGLEVASALVRHGLRPTVVELGSRLWSGQLGDGLAAWAGDRLSAAGVTLRLGAGVTRIADDAAWIGDDRLPAAFVVAGVGVTPRDDLARSAGLEVDDGIVADGEGRTSDPATWAAGDAARIDGRRVEHWHAAREAGERAALSLLGEPVPPVQVPWVFSELTGVSIDVFGSPGPGDDERWIGDGAMLAWMRAGRAVGLAVLGGAVAPDVARSLVGRGAGAAELRAAIAG